MIFMYVAAGFLLCDVGLGSTAYQAQQHFFTCVSTCVSGPEMQDEHGDPPTCPDLADQPG